MIETLALRNFKILREVDVRLRPLTVVVGPNASGKSSILQALAYLTERLSSPLAEVFAGQRSPANLSSRDGDGASRLGYRLSQAGVGALDFQVDFHREREGHVAWGQATELGEFRGQVPPELAAMIRPAAVIDLEFKVLAAPSYLPEITRVLPSDGAGLSWILANMSVEQPSRFKELVGRLKAVVPLVENIRLQPAYVWRSEIEQRGAERLEVQRRYNGFELLFDMKGAQGVPAYAVSEGTLLTLGLLTVLSAPHPPHLVLIDDLERGLHPRALGDLVQQIRRLQEQDPELQIVAASHSPYLLDYLQADEILLTSLGDDGYAAVKPLTAHPEYDRWKDVMAPGEFWSTVGERWVTEQAPR